MQTAYLDGFQINSPGVSATGVYVHSPVKGLGSAEVRYTGSDRVGMSGHNPIASPYGGRLLPLEGYIDADDATTYYQRRRDFAALIATMTDSKGKPVPKTLTFTMPDGMSYQVDVVLNGTPDMTWEYVIGGGEFLLPLLAPEPQILLQGQVTTSPITRPTGGGTTLPWTLPVTLGASSGGSVIATNLGTMYTWPTITLSGQLTNPYILNSRIDRYFQLQYTTTSPTDTIVIDTRPAYRTVTLNGTQAIDTAMLDDADFLWLEPGANAISFSSGSTSDTGTMSLAYYHAFGGI